MCEDSSQHGRIFQSASGLGLLHLNRCASDNIILLFFSVWVLVIILRSLLVVVIDADTRKVCTTLLDRSSEFEVQNYINCV